MNAIEMLHEDHLHMKQLLKQLVNTPAENQQAQVGLIERLEKDLALHTKLEEELFYPAFRQATQGTEDAMQFEALEEHHLIDQSLADARQSIGTLGVFEGRAKVLKELVEHHLQEEEHDMFPLVKRLVDQGELNALGHQMSARKAELFASASSVTQAPSVVAAASSSIAGAVGHLQERAREGVAVLTDNPAELVGRGVEEVVRTGASLAGHIISGARKGLTDAKHQTSEERKR